MKVIHLCLLSILFGSASLLYAQTELVPEIPTEVSEPPYEVGNLISEDGYFIDLDDGKQINFRIVDNKIRIYWVDKNRLIIEPEVEEVAVRFTSLKASNNYHLATRMSDDIGLGAPRIIQPPHRFNAVLALSEDLSYAFRYTPGLSVYPEE